MERITGVLDEIMNGQEYVDCDDFLEAGLLDSMDVMDLVDKHIRQFFRRYYLWNNKRNDV